tara:strand:+ start:193 stop:612 length:420 start_codon:yes stop_codon:yes gene_type:complete
MIDFNYVRDFRLENPNYYSDWLSRVVDSEEKELGDLNYIFCDDEYLLAINKQYLDHDTYTDIITFDYCNGLNVSGDIFISIERVEENAQEYKVSFEEELLRVMVHGVLHLLGFKDKSEKDAAVMRNKENEKIRLFHVEH